MSNGVDLFLLIPCVLDWNSVTFEYSRMTGGYPLLQFRVKTGMH